MAKAASALDKLKGAAKGGERKKATKKKERPVLELTPTEEGQVIKLCQVAYLAGEIEPLVKQHKKSVGTMLFQKWTQQMWDNKSVPDNPDAVVKKKDDAGQPTAMDDMKLQLQVKFRTAGLQTVLPDAAELGDDETVEEKLIEALTSPAVGLSEPNAKKFVEEEVTIRDEITLAQSLDLMLGADESTTDGKQLKAIGEKLVEFITKEPGKTGKVNVVGLTDEERAATLATKQVVEMKSGLFERITGYCEDVEQLRKLILYVKSTIQVSNFDFGMSDTDAERVERLKAVVGTYLLPE